MTHWWVIVQQFVNCCPRTPISEKKELRSGSAVVQNHESTMKPLIAMLLHKCLCTRKYQQLFSFTYYFGFNLKNPVATHRLSLYYRNMLLWTSKVHLIRCTKWYPMKHPSIWQDVLPHLSPLLPSNSEQHTRFFLHLYSYYISAVSRQYMAHSHPVGFLTECLDLFSPVSARHSTCNAIHPSDAQECTLYLLRLTNIVATSCHKTVAFAI